MFTDVCTCVPKTIARDYVCDIVLPVGESVSLTCSLESEDIKQKERKCVVIHSFHVLLSHGRCVCLWLIEFVFVDCFHGTMAYRMEDSPII